MHLHTSVMQLRGDGIWHLPLVIINAMASISTGTCRKQNMQVPLQQGPAILPESVRNRRFQIVWNRYWYRFWADSSIGVSIGIETMGFSIVSESTMVSSTKQFMFVPNNGIGIAFALALLVNLLVNQMGTTKPWFLHLS